MKSWSYFYDHSKVTKGEPQKGCHDRSFYLHVLCFHVTGTSKTFDDPEVTSQPKRLPASQTVVKLRSRGVRNVDAKVSSVHPARLMVHIFVFWEWVGADSDCGVFRFPSRHCLYCWIELVGEDTGNYPTKFSRSPQSSTPLALFGNPKNGLEIHSRAAMSEWMMGDQ